VAIVIALIMIRKKRRGQDQHSKNEALKKLSDNAKADEICTDFLESIRRLKCKSLLLSLHISIRLRLTEGTAPLLRRKDDEEGRLGAHWEVLHEEVGTRDQGTNGADSKSFILLNNPCVYSRIGLGGNAGPVPKLLAR